MVGYPVEVGEDDVKAAGVDLRISRKKADRICKVLNQRKSKFESAKKFVEDLTNDKENIDGKTYEGAAEGVLEVLENAEANAEFSGTPTEKLRIKIISAEPGTTLRRRRRRRNFGNKLKTANIKLVLERG